jgi:hypothetical protein
VQVVDANAGLLHEVLHLCLFEASWHFLEGLEQVTSPAQLEHAVMAVGVLEMLLYFHDVLTASHSICILYFAQRHLAELNGVALFSLLKLALVQDLDGKLTARRAASGLVHATKEGTLKVHDELVLLS